MERNQRRPADLTPREAFNKTNKYELVKMCCFFVAIMVNLIIWPAVNDSCTFNSTWYNQLFLYYYVIPITLIRMYCLKYWNREDRVMFRAFIVNAFCGILSAIWVVYLMVGYDSFTPYCYDPFPSLSLAIMCTFVIFIIPQAFITMTLALVILIFSPCLIISCVSEYQRR